MPTSIPRCPLQVGGTIHTLYPVVRILRLRDTDFKSFQLILPVQDTLLGAFFLAISSSEERLVSRYIIEFKCFNYLVLNLDENVTEII